MPRGKHTVCSHCRSKGHYTWIEVLWRVRSHDPYTCVVGWLCAVCRSAMLDFIGELGAQVKLLDG